MSNKFVMVVDMVRFSKIQGHYTACFGPDGENKLVSEIKNIFTDGFHLANQDYDKALLKWGGDGGIYQFDQAEDAHDVAFHILKNSQQFNEKGRKINDECLLRCFRIGIAFGELTIDANKEANGNVITVATRLETSGKPELGGCSGEIRICPETYRHLPEKLRELYGDEEMVRGKSHDGKDGKFPAHRHVVATRAIWEPRIKPPKNKQSDTVRINSKGVCFVISPIDQHNKRNAEIFDKLITPACKELKYEPIRADQIPGLDRPLIITGQLSKAPLAIAYLGKPVSNWNDNVMLEIGYRISIGLPLVMICDELPPPRKGDKTISLKNLLPFHLAQKNVIQVPKKTELSIDPLVAEMKIAISDSSQRETWNSEYPVVELKFSNVHEDLTLTYISPEAKKLFGMDGETIPNIKSLSEKFKERMNPTQYKAYMKERMNILAYIRDQGMGLGNQNLDNGQASIPRAQIPIIFKEDESAIDGKPKGYLPIIIRHLFHKGTMHMSTLYLEVSSCLNRHPDGYWICNI